jgi:prevent-host-death family protein
MTRKEVGVRELKAQLSAYLREVEAGKAVTITKRGKPIGRIVPVAQPTEARLKALDRAGLIAWNGKKLQPMAPVAQARGDRTVADLLLEDRE